MGCHGMCREDAYRHGLLTTRRHFLFRKIEYLVSFAAHGLLSLVTRLSCATVMPLFSMCLLGLLQQTGHDVDWRHVLASPPECMLPSTMYSIEEIASLEYEDLGG